MLIPGRAAIALAVLCDGGVSRAAAQESTSGSPTTSRHRRDRRAAGAGGAGHHLARRQRPGDRARDPAVGAARRRRFARRSGLHREPAVRRPDPDRAGHRAARLRAHRPVADVRRPEHLRRRPGLRFGAARRVDRQRVPPRQRAAQAERPHRRRVRHLLRPAQRVHVLRQPARRVLRLLDHRRGPAQQRLESGVERPHRPLRRRLDDGDDHPVQVAALRRRRQPDLGLPGPPLGPAQERVVVPHRTAGVDGRTTGPQPRLALWQRHRHRRPGGGPHLRDQAVCAGPIVHR